MDFTALTYFTYGIQIRLVCREGARRRHFVDSSLSTKKIKNLFLIVE